MRQAEDWVWSAITQSAMRRVDFAEFKSRISEVPDERLADYVLFQLIVRTAEEMTIAERDESIAQDLAVMGESLPEGFYDWFETAVRPQLTVEIHAAQRALLEFSQGSTYSSVLAELEADLL